MRRVTIAILFGAFLLGTVLAAEMQRLPDKRFEFGVQRDFVGTIREYPAPSLIVGRPGRAEGVAANSRYLLTAPGKFGAQTLVSDLDGRMVHLRGSLIYREDQTMIELVPGSIKILDQLGADPELPVELGEHVFVGEIVDSKCFLGVMAPGSAKVHRSCATRCIAGGIPPVLLVRQADGTALYLLLVGEDGEAVNERVLDLVAERVEIQGRVQRLDETLVLRADPSSYRRFDP